MTQPSLPIGPTPVIPQDEKGFQAWIEKCAKRLGWTTNRTYAARFMSGRYGTTTTHKGWPDITAVLPAVLDDTGATVHDGRVLFLEVKGAGSSTKMYPEQVATIELLQRVGGNVVARFVRPKDWEDVLVLLRAGRGSDG